ncbi:MAG: PRC-barrel domain-containing protein [Candidatus Krumholzibacteriia bacterium]
MKFSLAVILVHLLVLPAVAQDMDLNRPYPDRFSYQPNLVSADAVLDQVVRDAAGNELADIKALILDPSHRSIAYLVVETDDDVFGDDMKKAVPWPAFSFKRESDDKVTVVLNVPKSRLIDAADFSDDELVGDAMFIRDVYQAFGPEFEREYRKHYTDQARFGAWPDMDQRKVDKLIDTDLVRRDGKEIGEVEDLIVEAAGGQIVYAVLDLNDDTRDRHGMKRDKVVAPWQALDTQGEDFVLVTDERNLNKLTYDYKKVGISKLEDSEFALHVHRAVNVQPYWQDPRMQERFADAHEFSRSRWAPERQQDRYGRSQQQDEYGWSQQQDRYDRSQPQDRYGRSQPQDRYGWSQQDRGRAAGRTVKVVSGTVEQIMTRPVGNIDEMVVKLRTHDGDVAYARLGPNWYVEQQNFDIRRGDEITVTGMEVASPGQPEVYIARSAQTARSTLRVRDEDFRPNWESRRYGGDW